MAEQEAAARIKINKLLEAAGPRPPPPSNKSSPKSKPSKPSALVSANCELITRFEKKILATLARVWGEKE